MSKPWFDWPELSRDYAAYHTRPENRLCHLAGIPLIMLAIVRWTQVGVFPWAALVLPLYLFWEPRLGLIMGVVLAAMALVARALPVWAAPAAFVAGWVFQIIGHEIFEKKKPALLSNPIHALIGPLWILKEVLRRNETTSVL